MQTESIAIEESQDIAPDYVGTATYSPEDNKLRLYPFARLDSKTYQRVKAAGFAWAPRQELFVAPMWTPVREDLLVELCGEIGDEDTSLVERAEFRAERFEELSDKRESDANRAYQAVTELADAIPLGQPILVGHHSERRARKDAEKIRGGMSRAVKMWETSKYWEDRAKGALSHAKYKERPEVRARRIKGLEADKRKQEKAKREAQMFLAAWTNPDKELTKERAMGIANYCHISRCFPLAEYPRDLPASQYEGPMSLWSALDDDIITAQQARDIAVPSHESVIAWADRWIKHYEYRLLYERAMLGESGGLVTDRVKPEKGGAIKCWIDRREWIEIQKVNKVSVTVRDNWGNGGPDFNRTIKFDEITAVMSKADYEAYKRGENAEAQAHDIAQIQKQAERSQAFREEIKAEESSVFGQMRESLRQGVQVVSAPQLFPTPPDLAVRMVRDAGVGPGQRILEPSAGTGNLIRPIANAMGGLDCGYLVTVEVNSSLVNGLCEMRQKWLYGNENTWKIIRADFLETSESELGTFDRIIMNPPFENGVDIKHIKYAMTFLKPGGKLVALCANGPRQREALQPLASYWEDLPAGTFASQGTGVNVALLVIEGA